MAKVDLGEKQACPECEKKFYDLTKRPAVCPYCSTSFDPNELSAPAQPLKTNMDEPEEEVVATETDDEADADEVVAKELELDGDSASFGGSESGGDDGDDTGDAPDMDGFSSSDDEDEDEATSTDDEEEDVTPPTQKEDEEPEEVEI